MKRYFYIILGVAFVISAIPASADTIIQEINGPANTTTSGSYVFSDVFTANVNSYITEFGYYDDNNTNSSQHEVGLFNNAGTLLGSTTISAGQNYSGNFDWASIAPIALTAGQTYTIAGVSHGDTYGYYGLPTSSSLFTFLRTDYYGGASLFDSALDGADTHALYNGPNAVIVDHLSSVPEPTSISLLAAGLFGFGLSRKIKRLKHNTQTGGIPFQPNLNVRHII